MFFELVALELNLAVHLYLGPVVLREVVQLGFEWSELQQLPFGIQLFSFTLGEISVLFGELVRQDFLLVMENLEVLLGAYELIVKVLALLFGV